MNSRINSGDGFQIPQKKEFQFMGSWIPVTPEKPIPARSNLVSADGHGNQLGRVNWQEPNRIPGGVYTDGDLCNNGAAQNINPTEQLENQNGSYYHNTSSSLGGRNELINRIAGSYTQAWNNNQRENVLTANSAASVASVNRNLAGNVGSLSSPLMQNPDSQVDNWRDFDLDDLLFTNQIHCSFSSLLNGDSFYQIHQDGPPASHQPLYDLNSFPREANGSSIASSSVHFMPLTPIQAKQIDNGQLIEGLILSAGDNLSQEKEHPESRVGNHGDETTQQIYDGLLQNIVGSSLAESTTSKELNDSSKQNDHGIDLNKTPQQKPPKRKKHRPKVVVEGKPKRTPKLATPANANLKENQSRKRKHVLKTNMKDPAIQHPEVIKETRDPSPENPAKTCRRALNFDLETPGDGMRGNTDSQQNACNNSDSDSQIRVAITGDMRGCKDWSLQVGPQNGLQVTNQQPGLPTENWQPGLPIGNGQPGSQIRNQQSGRPMGNGQSGVSMGNRKPWLPMGNGQPGFPVGNGQQRVLMGNRQAGLLIGNRQTAPSTGKWKQGLPMGNGQLGLPMGNGQPGLPVGKWQSGTPIGNGQPSIPIGNRQPGLPTGNGQAGSLMGNQQAGSLMGNQQAGSLMGNQQPESPKGIPQLGSLIGNLQPGLSIENRQPGLPIGNQQAGLLKGNRQAGLLMGNRQPGLLIGSQQPGTVGSYTSSLNQKINGYTTLPQKQAAESSPQAPAANLHMEIQKNVARNVSLKTNGTCERSSRTEYSSLQQNVHVGFHEVRNSALDMTRKLMSQSISQSTPAILSKPHQTRGSKREYHHIVGQMQNSTMEAAVRSSLFQQISRMQFEKDNSCGNAAFLEAQKKMKIHNGLNANMPGMPREVIEIEDDPGQALNKDLNDINVNGISKGNHGTSHSVDIMGGSNQVDRFTGNQPAEDKAYGHNQATQQMSCERNSYTERRRESMVRSSACTLVPPTPPRKASATGNELVVYLAKASNMQAAECTQSKSASSRRNKTKEKQIRSMRKKDQQSGKITGPSAKLSYPDPVDEIVQRLQNLDLNGTNNQIVLFRGGGTVVPYEGLDFIKKRKPRPKVDLDQETNRIWNLLMGKGGSEGDQELDKEKEKWWEEERKVFRGRADSFIARMHLVQGDRRFSPWKGSVVDSVIGVFLTQNVTDHLSSSAFMSLAARFPLKSNCNGAEVRNETSTLVEEPEVSILNLNDVPACQEKVVHRPPNRQGSGIESSSKDYQRDNQNIVIERVNFVETYSQNLEEEVLSSQDSFDPAMLQSSGGVGSCSGSNSDAEFSTTRCEQKTDPISVGNATSYDEIYSRGNGSPLLQGGSDSRHVQETTICAQKKKQSRKRMDNRNDSSLFSQPANCNNWQVEVPANPSNSYQQHSMSQSQVLDIEDFGMRTKGKFSSWLSVASGIDEGNKEVDLHKRVRQAGYVAYQARGHQNETPGLHELQALGSYTFSSHRQRYQESISLPGSHIQYNLLCSTKQNEMNKSFQSPSMTRELLNSGENSATRQSSTVRQVLDAPELKERSSDAEQTINSMNRNISLENKLAESNSSNQDRHTVEVYKKRNSSILKAKKGKPDNDKKTDWDSLRKEVDSNGRRKERTKDMMDSIDYEAIRRASVEEISEAIKERGMNNMLAERIKEFLDRIVREHGSVDLEWLRDVPPDKAKDYLLSIRGLGLKSVECVRLLTLHNLAFPVDTNVGRIAVRLGWVPLQPLPESLQLHLLELYPVLESIQKYLWPRLCKLDQPTLYELHYQLITFGKVFCTKSKPNCNACPMRGECRHFASAFASARLALPGPEEKSITSATAPIPTETSSTTVHTMRLPPPEKISLREGRDVGTSEPIIEEPATPEQEWPEVSESDIEDTYDEDPDEIPTIRLNLEEFTANLQQYMEKNMELQEGDMSKALVALNPTAASIPTPKLKNVSRLRTEHQVYQLPDSHPLLEGMDRREPDDPSPYLLAIWTPGETANSTQPPERKCESQDPGILCNDETCFSCNSIREANSNRVRGTLLIPCRTAMRGSFPLNGTYFQVNEVFADHASSLNPIDVPREWIWNLPRRIVYFGTSVSAIFRGLTTEQIQYCFWKGFVCVRGFDQKTRAPRPLTARLHFPASRLKTKNESKK